jgi:hypothetical protein
MVTEVPKDMAGLRFGMLVVVARAKPGAWLCRCDCGCEKVIRRSALKGGTTRSCGCSSVALRLSAPRYHHRTRSPAWRSWSHMIWRCRTDARYAGRGIAVCERWREFANFLADMGERSPGTSLDRINNDGNYEPGNCRWATQAVQCGNTRRTRKIEIGGVVRTMSEWARLHGVSPKLAQARIVRLGWTPALAVSLPSARQR